MPRAPARELQFYMPLPRTDIVVDTYALIAIIAVKPELVALVELTH